MTLVVKSALIDVFELMFDRHIVYHCGRLSLSLAACFNMTFCEFPLFNRNFNFTIFRRFNKSMWMVQISEKEYCFMVARVYP